jgi:hypothetical protein
MRVRLGLLVVLLVANVGCPGGDSAPQGAPPCGPAGECGSGLVCDPGTDTCVVPDDAYWCSFVNCPNGQVCDLTTETGCRPAASCAEVTCDAGTYCDPVTFYCTSTPRCGAGGACPTGLYCEAGLCHTPGPGGCVTTADCQDGYTCELTTHLCRGAVACASQDVCAGGWTCTAAGWCELLPAGICDAPNDCAATEGCDGGFCTGCATAGTVCSGNFVGCDSGTNRCAPCTSSCTHPGDVCGSAIPLTISLGRTVVSVDLGGYACDGTDCEAGLADVYWSVTLPSRMQLELGVGSAAYDARHPRLEIIPADCGGRIAHHVFTDSADRESMVLPAGQYRLRLVGAAADATPYALVITAAQPLVYGSSCESPDTSFTYYGGGTYAGTWTFTRDVGGYSPHLAGDACADADWGPESVLAIDLPLPGWISATADPTGNATLGVEVKDVCLEEAAYTCNTTPGATVTASRRRVPAGRQYVVIHFDPASYVAYNLAVAWKAWPAYDQCAQPYSLIFSNYPTGSGSTADDQSLPDAPLACDGTTWNGNDQFFTFTTTGDQSVTVTVTPDAPGTWTPVVALESACGQVNGLACAVGAPGTATTFSLGVIEPGRYVVHVMSGSGPGGPFDVEVDLGNPVYPDRPNESCVAPEVPEVLQLPSVGASVTTTGDTRGGGEESFAVCGWDTRVGDYAPDLAYQVVLPPEAPRGRVRVTATPLRATFDPALTAQTTCASGAADLGCWNSSGPGVAETGAFPVNGSALVWVKGAGHEDSTYADGTQGPFELTATYEAAAPANDVCADAATSTLTMPTATTAASVTGDLAAATSSGATTCYGGLIDAFHALTVAGGGGATEPVNVTLTPSGFTGRLRIFLNDCSNCYLATYEGTGVGAPVVLPTTMRAGDVRTIAVSSLDGKVGTYTLTAAPP